MRDELYSNLGFYNSAFIKMHVKTEESLHDFANISLETEATYFHEYIHFLQDITTSYGLMNINNIVNYIKYTNDVILKDKVSEFEVPIQIQASSDHDVQANWELKNIYLGSGEGLNDIAKFNSIYKSPTTITTSKGEKKVDRVIFDFDDSLGRNHKYAIGAYCISESMAYTMENLAYPGVLPVPNKLPYESVKIICDILYPGFSSNPLNIIAICDACMMLFNPGIYLYDALVEMAKNSFNYSDPGNIYQHIYSKTKFKYNGHTTIQQLLISQGALAINQLSDYFTTPHFRDNKMWINYVISSGIDLRITHPYLMIEIALNGKILSERISETGRTIESIFFNEIRHKLGSPLVVNDSFEMTFNSTSFKDFDVLPEYFWAINQVYKIYSKPLNNGTYKCEMIEWCNNSCADQGIEEYTDERCRNAPWERAKDSDPNPCTFGRLWKSWGLMNEYPV